MTRLPSGPRLALAADLNDLIAHRIAAVQVQAAAAERLLDAADTGAARAIQAVRGLTAEAMDELRRLARLLDDGAPLPLAPVPGFAEGLPGGVAVCAYRCVELLAGCDLTFGVSDDVSRLPASPAPSDVVGRSLRGSPARWLEIRCRGELDARREASLRAFVRPCAGTLRRRSRDGWSIKLPLEP